MEKVFARTTIGKEAIQTYPEAESIMKRQLIGKIAEEAFKNGFVRFTVNDDSEELKQFHQVEVRGQLIVATPEEMKEFELMKEFIKDNNDQENFENFKDWQKELNQQSERGKNNE